MSVHVHGSLMKAGAVQNGERLPYDQQTKRISLKSIIFPNEALDLKRLSQDAMIKLQDAVVAVFENRKVNLTLEELYRNVEDVCVQGSMCELYSSLQTLFIDFVQGLLPVFCKEDLTLVQVSQTWEHYCRKLLLIRSIFLNLDRRLPTDAPQHLPLWDLALHLFHDTVLSIDSIVTRIRKQLLEKICAERHGEAVDRRLLRSVVRMLVDLRCYTSAFEGHFLRQTEHMYTQEADTLVEQLSVADYLAHVNRRINEEEDRLTSYLDAVTTREKLLATLETELISKKTDQLLSTGLVGLLENRRVTELALFYSLLHHVDGGIEKLRTHFRTYIKKRGRDIVQNPNQDPEKERTMIQSLLDFRDFIDDLIETCFRGDTTFTRALHDAFDVCVNSRPNKPAEFLAKYLDAYLRTGNKKKTDEELYQVMDKAMSLLRFVDGKDVFEAFYTKELAKRLLLSKSASKDAELAMLSKLKQECGPAYTSKMETMFQDIALSEELSKNFRASQPSTVPLEFTVNVICPSSWPAYPQLPVNYPPEMLSLREEFTTFYRSYHQGRRLVYEPSLGMCVVRAILPTTPDVRKELQVSEFQALVLLQFNGSPEVALTYTEIAEATGIEEEQLKRTLLSLGAGKNQRILIMKPLTVNITPEHSFLFNAEFNNRCMRRA